MDVISERAALLIIDVQEVLAEPAQGELNNPGAEETIVMLLGQWRRAGLPVFHVRYLSPRPGSPFHQGAPGTKIKASVKPLPGEPVISKHFESAFMKTDLEERLRRANLHTLVVVGFYTDQCIASTVKVANNLGFKVMVLADATATTGCNGYNGQFYKAEDLHQVALGSLQRDGISISTANDLLLF
jgi:nicotinamidase-related amidase